MARKWWTLILVCLAAFMLLLDITIVNVALPNIQRNLGASLSSLQWVVDAYALTLASFLLVAGSIGDRFGRRRVFSVGFGIFTFASLLCGISPDPTLLNLARGVQGIGGAAMFATTLALIAQEFDGRERATALGAWGATVGGAIAIGPLVGGALTDGLGWEWIFHQRPDRDHRRRADGAQARQRHRHRPPAAGLARSAHVLSRSVPADLRSDPRQPGRLVQRADHRLTGRRDAAPGRLSGDPGAPGPARAA